MIACNKIRTGHVYSIGRKTQELVKEANGLNYNIGKQVEVITGCGGGLFTVRDTLTGFAFDVCYRSLGKLVKEKKGE